MAAPRSGGSQSSSSFPQPHPSSSSSAIPAPSPSLTSVARARTVATAAPSATPGPSVSIPPQQPRRSSSGASTKHIRRVNTQDRISDILELGRERAETMSPARNPQDHEPDELTGIITRGPTGGGTNPAMNYQSTVESAGTRARRAARGGADSPGGSRSASKGRAAPPNGAGNGLPGHENGNGAAADKEEGAWWRSRLAYFGSIELENKGSVARDHLALERTFLAWLRTSLAFASIGIAITQLFRLNTSLADGGGGPPDSASQTTLRHLGKPLGAVFLGISILILFLGYHRFFQAQRYIILGKFPASRGTVVLVSLVALVLMVISLVVVVVVQPSSGVR